MNSLEDPAVWFPTLGLTACLSCPLFPFLCSLVSYVTCINRMFQKDPDESWDCVLPPEARDFPPDPLFLHFTVLMC